MKRRQKQYRADATSMSSRLKSSKKLESILNDGLGEVKADNEKQMKYVERVDDACPWEDCSFTNCHNGDPANGGKFLINGVCDVSCTRLPGVPLSYCGSGPSYSAGKVIDCSKCR